MSSKGYNPPFEAVSSIRDRLIGVETMPKAVTLWQQLTQG